MSFPEWLSREAPLLGEEGIMKLAGASVLIVGVGGVGGYALEALVRAGIGRITVVDGDCVDETNLNRQIITTRENIGKPKAVEAAKRASAINPDCRVETVCRNIDRDSAAEIISRSDADFIADACDDTAAKILLAKYASENGVGIISCMGTGNKLDPSLLRIGDVFETSVCPLARSIRKKLKDENITRIPVVYSTEPPRFHGPTPSSVSFVPAAAGILMASYIIRSICGLNN